MTMTRKTITIPDQMDDWVKAQIGAGRYGNDSEYFRDLIRKDQENQDKMQALRAAVTVGRESGITDSTMDDILKEVQTEIKHEL